MNVREIQRKKTRRKLTDAFFKLYEENSIEKISIKEITALAECHRSTFYEYFADVYDLLKQEEDSIIDLQMKNIINPAKEHRIDFLNTSSFMGDLLNLYEQKSDYILVLLGDHGDPAFQRKIKTNIMNSAKEILKFPENDPMTDYYLEFLISGVFAVINRMYKEKDISLDMLVKHLHPIISKTLSFSGKA